jgi:hypothetical protein
MVRVALTVLACLAIGAGVMSEPVLAADAVVHAAPAPRMVIEAPPPVIVEQETLESKPVPHVAYGCKRIWRCDAQVCEWRRGCWGIYGYIESPYYSLPLARRQWERDGLPTSR